MPRLLEDVDQTNEPLLVTTNKSEDVQQRVVIIPQDQYIMMINKINEVK